MTRAFVAAIGALAEKKDIPVVQFAKAQRKEAIAQPYFEAAAAAQPEGLVLIGITQEKANVFRPPSKLQRQVGKFAPTRASAFAKHVYLYIWDRDFGPGFISTYAPFQVRVWLNGHQWLRQRLTSSGHYLEPLDNGIADVDDQPWSASASASSSAGSTGCPAPSLVRIAVRVTPTSSACFNSRSVAPRSSTARSTAASCSRR